MIFAVYKPKGPTSYDVIRQIKKIIGKDKKIGHAGTLDPLASGVLVIAIGREATKKISKYTEKPRRPQASIVNEGVGAPTETSAEKEYVAKIRLGETSTTDDEEGEKTSHTLSPELVEGMQYRDPSTPLRSAQEIMITNIQKVLPPFIGKIQQIPPAYSAIKINGEEAYKRIRKGEAVAMKPREVEIKSIEILDYKYPFLTIKVITGPGVYIRSLARDIGEKLGVGGYLADLERTRVGDFKKEDTIPMEQINKLLDDKTF